MSQSARYPLRFTCITGAVLVPLRLCAWWEGDDHAFLHIFSRQKQHVTTHSQTHSLLKTSILLSAGCEARTTFLLGRGPLRPTSWLPVCAARRSWRRFKTWRPTPSRCLKSDCVVVGRGDGLHDCPGVQGCSTGWCACRQKFVYGFHVATLE